MPSKNVVAFREMLASIPELSPVSEKLNWAVDHSKRAFSRLHIRVKKEIVADHQQVAEGSSKADPKELSGMSHLRGYL